MGGGMTMGLVAFLVAGVYWAQSKGHIQLPFSLPFLPKGPGKGGHMALSNGTPVPRPRAKSLTVHVTRADDESEEHEVSVMTKGLKTVADLGEAVADALAKELHIEEPFKMYYVDADSDDLLVNAHTTLKELLGSECVTARLERLELPPPRAARAPREKRAKPKPAAVVPSRKLNNTDFD